MQQKKGDKIFSVAIADTHLIFDIYLISLPKKPQISTKITFKNNKFTRQRTLNIPEHNPLKRLYQFHHRNQVNILTLSCIPIICYFKAL